MLDWQHNDDDIDYHSAQALGGLLVCVANWNESDKWFYAIQGDQATSKGGFETADQAQAACERALAGLLWPQFNQLSIIIRVDRAGNILEALTEVEGRNPGPDYHFIDTKITSNVPPSISIAAEYGDTLVTLGQIKDTHAFRALYHNSQAKDWQPVVK